MHKDTQDFALLTYLLELFLFMYLILFLKYQRVYLYWYLLLSDVRSFETTERMVTQ